MLTKPTKLRKEYFIKFCKMLIIKYPFLTSP